MTYVVTWHAAGLGRTTAKRFRSWKGAVAWWVYLRAHDHYEARINRRGPARGLKTDSDVTPPWPTRRVRALVRQERAIQAEIVLLQDAAIARATRKGAR